MMAATVESIWRDFAEQLRRYIRSRVSDDATAEDLLQDVFVRIQNGLSKMGEPAKLQGWIFTIARNAVIDHYRSQRETVPLPETLVDANPGDPDVEGLKAAFRRMIDALPEPYRSAVVLTELEGLTQRELAKRCGISVSGAKSRVQRGREQLKQSLLECCEFEFDRRGGIVGCSPRSRGGCRECS